MKSIQKQMDQITATTLAHKAKSPTLDEAVKLLSGTKGVGENSAISLLVAMPELGKISNKEGASLAGLAPFNRESGKCAASERSTEGVKKSAKHSTWPP